MTRVNEIKDFINKLKFTELLKTKWDEAHEGTAIFRYKINGKQERIIQNSYILQLNPERKTNRRIPEQINNIRQPLDLNKFNFTKASSKEVLISIGDDNDPNQHKILINVSPISKHHSLLCPYVNELLPQLATEGSLKLCLDIMFLAHDRELKIVFNSLCAFASINHLHYHLLFENNVLPVERANWDHLKGSLYCLQDYVVPAFCFTVFSSTIAPQTKEIYKLIDYLLNKSIAHNILISRKSLGNCIEVYIYPRKSTKGVKLLKAFNVASCELSGLILVHCPESYELLDRETLDAELKKWRIDNFNELKENVMLLY